MSVCESAAAESAAKSAAAHIAAPGEGSAPFARLHHSQTPRRSTMTANTPGASRAGLTRAAGADAHATPDLDHATANSFVDTFP